MFPSLANDLLQRVNYNIVVVLEGNSYSFRIILIKGAGLPLHKANRFYRYNRYV